MTAKEQETIYDAAALLGKIPPLRGVVTDVTAYRTAAQDYDYVVTRMKIFLQEYCAYARWKPKMGTDEVDDEFLEQCKQSADNSLQEIKEFIERRTKEGWE